MKRTSLIRGAFFLWVLCLFGCVNDDNGYQRRETKTVNGGDYITGAEHEANVFGRESAGLNSNQKVRPDKSILGEPNPMYTDAIVSIQPEKTESLINTSISFVISAKAIPSTEQTIAESEGRDPKYESDIPNLKYVVELNRAAAGNGSLVFDDGGTLDTNLSDDSRLVINSIGSVVNIHLMTGNGYSPSKPMYYINVWQANADDPASAEVHVVQPLIMNPDGTCSNGSCKQGEHAVNDETFDSDELPADTSMTSATLELLDSPVQDIFIGSKKDLRVRLNGQCNNEAATGGSGKCPDDIKEKVCWTFVGRSSINDANVISGNPAFKYTSFVNETSGTKLGGCVDNLKNGGIFTITLDTGTAYDATYYLNFFHSVASKATYQINTYVMPAVLGEQGNGPGADLDGDGINDGELELIVPDTLDKTGTLSSEETYDLLCKAPLIYDATIQSIMKDHCGGDCTTTSRDSFKCTIADDHGKWIIFGPDTFPLKEDIDGDGKKDTVSIVVTVDEETGEIYYTGIDLDGDGVPDIAPDPCISLPDPSTCKDKTIEIWCSATEKGQYHKVCSKILSPIQSVADIYIKLYQDEQPISDSIRLDANLIRGSYKVNDASFDKNKDITQITVDTPNGAATINLWMGTAFDALYYIQLTGNNVRPARVPVEATYFLDLPTAEGDEADKSEAIIPPSGMEGYNYDIGPVQLLIEVYEPTTHSTNYVENHDIVTPVYRSMNLKVVATSKKTGKPAKDVKMYWKLTRGKSPNNNATISSTQNKSDSSGLASNNFYAGSGYDSLYYVTVFSPNALNSDDPSSTDYQFVTFSIKTENFKGVLPDPDPEPDNITPVTPDGKNCCVLKTIYGVPQIDEATGNGICADGSKFNPECKDALFVSVNGEQVDPRFPQGVPCNINEDGTLSIPTPRYPEPVPGSEEAETYPPGCLSMSVSGASLLDMMTNGHGTLNVMIKWNDGTETRGISTRIYADLLRNDTADCSLSSNPIVSAPNGIGSFIFNSGSFKTTYYVDAWHPNIHQFGTKIPVRFTINVVSESQTQVDPSDENSFYLTSIQTDELKQALSKNNKKIDYVRYFVLGNATCDNDFIFKSESEQASACEANNNQYKDTDKDFKFDKACSINVSTSDNDYKSEKEIQTLITKGPFAVYSIAYQNGKGPVAFACNDTAMFPVRATTTNRKKDVYCTLSGSITADQCSQSTHCEPAFEIDHSAADTCHYETNIKEKVLELALNLNEIPFVIADTYYIKSLVDISSLIVDENGDLPPKEECTEANSVGCVMRKVKDAYDGFMGQSEDIIDAIYEKLFGIFIYKPGKATSTEAMNCVKYLCGGSGENIRDVCPNGNDNDCEPGSNNDCKDGFKSCSCVCGKFYYYSALYEMQLPGVGKVPVGELISEGLESLIKNLLRNAINVSSLEDMLCEFIDTFQYVTLHGELNLTDKTPSDMQGKMGFTGLDIPFTDTGFDFTAHSGVVSGKWENGTLTNGVDMLSITNLPLKFSYGEAIYDVLLRLLGADGKLVNLISCSNIFKNGITIPIVGTTINANEIDELCQSALGIADDKIINLLESKNIDLNLNLNGSAQFVKTKDAGKAPGYENAYYYDQIQNGTLSGAGQMGNQQSNVEGYWVGSNINKDSIPDIIIDDQDLDTWKQEHSLCRRILEHEPSPTPQGGDKYISNKDCLGGSYQMDNIELRSSKNKCSEDDCKPNNNASIVVCTSNGTLDPTYAYASDYAIIKAANTKCRNYQSDEKCQNNPEIVHYKNGSSIQNVGYSYNCPKNDTTGDYECTKTSGSGSVYDEIGQALVSSCNEECDNPYCVMNTAWNNPKCTANELGQVIAKWDKFDNADKTTNYLSDREIKPDKDSNASCLRLKLSNISNAADNPVLLVPGTKSDTKGALAINAVNATIEVITAGYTINKITFKLMGDDRAITYNGTRDITTNSWKLYETEPNSSSPYLTINLTNQSSMSTNYSDYSMIRIDEITVYGSISSAVSCSEYVPIEPPKDDI